MFSFLRDDDSKFVFWRVAEPRKRAPVIDIKKVLDRSYHYLTTKDSKENLYNDLLLGLEGYSLFYSDAFKAAYLYGWMVIETVIDRIWKEYVTALKISSDDKKNLKYSSQWTVHHKTEVLFASKSIDPRHRDLLKGLRKKRNDIVHEKQTVSPEEAFRCLRLATVTTLNRMLGNTDIFHDPKETQLVKMWDRNRD